jgi:hypothetical protein
MKKTLLTLAITFCVLSTASISRATNLSMGIFQHLDNGVAGNGDYSLPQKPLHHRHFRCGPDCQYPRAKETAATISCRGDSGQRVRLVGSRTDLSGLMISRKGVLEHYALQRTHTGSGATWYDLLDENGQRVPLGEGRWANLFYNENQNYFYLYDLGQLSNGHFVCR